jgi:hypothetical protein
MTNAENIAEAVRYAEYAIENETSWRGWYVHDLLDTLRTCGGTQEQIEEVELVADLLRVVGEADKERHDRWWAAERAAAEKRLKKIL